jgi:hypothetical protein
MRLSPEERARYKKRLLQSLEQTHGLPLYTTPLSISLEIQKLSPAVPKLPTENPFERPLRLFDAK